MSKLRNEKVAVIGSGLIGRSWSMLFAGAGYSVCLYDIDSDLASKAPMLIKEQLLDLESKGVLRGKLSAKEQAALISTSTNMAECIIDAVYLQECVPEFLELKQKVWLEIDKNVKEGDSNIILASSTSSMNPETFSKEMKNRNRIVVAHPVNPPYFVPLVEVVGATYTDDDVVPRTVKIQEHLGQSPVVMKKYKLGFVLNRIQYAILNECWRLYQDDVMSLEDIDTVMTAGLARRYAFMGPFETIHLNAEGTTSYMERYGSMIERVSNDSGDIPKYSEPEKCGLKEVEEEMCKKVPLNKLKERMAWRDERLLALAKLINEKNSDE